MSKIIFFFFKSAACANLAKRVLQDTPTRFKLTRFITLHLGNWNRYGRQMIHKNGMSVFVTKDQTYKRKSRSFSGNERQVIHVWEWPCHFSAGKTNQTLLDERQTIHERQLWQFYGQSLSRQSSASCRPHSVQNDLFFFSFSITKDKSYIYMWMIMSFFGTKDISCMRKTSVYEREKLHENESIKFRAEQGKIK